MKHNLKVNAFVPNLRFIRPMKHVNKSYNIKKLTEETEQFKKDPNHKLSPLTARNLAFYLKDFCGSYARMKFNEAIGINFFDVAMGSIGGNSDGRMSSFKTFQTTPRGEFQSGSGRQVQINHHRYDCIIDSPTEGKACTVPHGYGKKTVKLYNSLKDHQNTSYRLSRISETSFNQKSIDFQSEETYLTVAGLKEITECGRNVQDYKEKLDTKKRRAQVAISNSTGRGEVVRNINKNLAREQISHKVPEELRSKILKLNYEIEIQSSTEGYPTYVTVHLCNQNQVFDCDGTDLLFKPSDLLDRILKDRNDPTKVTLAKGDILKKMVPEYKQDVAAELKWCKENEEPDIPEEGDKASNNILKKRWNRWNEDRILNLKGNWQFKLVDVDESEEYEKDAMSYLTGKLKHPNSIIKQIGKSFDKITVKPHVNLFQAEAIKESIRVVESFRFILRPTEIGTVSVTQNFPDGISLFDLDRIYNMEAPAGYFFIVETVGDSRAQIHDKRAPQIHINGTAPTSITYNYKTSVTYIYSESADRELAVPFIHKTPNSQFAEGELAEYFYPEREQDFTTDISNIQINQRNPDAKYVLDMDARYLNSFNPLEAMQKATKKKWLNIDDLPNFIELANATQKRLDESNSNSTVVDEDDEELLFNEDEI